MCFLVYFEQFFTKSQIFSPNVFPRLIKSPYKMYSLNIPYFMRVCKRFDAKKIRKIG